MWEQKGFMFSAGIQGRSEAEIERYGLHTGHAYSLLKAREVNKNG